MSVDIIDCLISIYSLGLLDVARPSLPINTKNAIYSNILQSIKGISSCHWHKHHIIIFFFLNPPPLCGGCIIKQIIKRNKYNKSFCKYLVLSIWHEPRHNVCCSKIFFVLSGPQPLRCYRNNSFITFLNESLYGFGPLPNVTTFLSLIPPTRISEVHCISSQQFWCSVLNVDVNWCLTHVFQIVNSIATSELGSYLRQPEVLNNDSQICAIFNSFAKSPEFLDTVSFKINSKMLKGRLCRELKIIFKFIIFFFFYRKRFQIMLKVPSFPVSGLWRWQVPMRQRLICGLTVDWSSTWSSWTKI